MRVLWFSMSPSMFNPHTNGYNGLGWVASLEAITRTLQEVELGIAFYLNDSPAKVVKDEVTYYSMPIRKKSPWQLLLERHNEEKVVSSYLRIIEDFKPDLIHVFGSENDFGLICKKVQVPVVIHIQGCMPPYHNALFPVGMNVWDFLFSGGLTLRARYWGLRSEPNFRSRANREVDIIKHCRYFMGRTDWDKNLISLFHPEATYFHCEEALRDSFLKLVQPWSYKERGIVKIISVISSPWYKGVDLILKTARVLKDFTALDFEWNVYGVSDICFYEHKYKILAKDVNVNVRGSASQETLVKELADSSCYVHSSYIENSPNSLCEAQIVGIPVLATHVGGIPTLVENGAGALYPANDPYTLAGLIKRSAQDKEWAQRLSEKEREVAVRRHHPEQIGSTLLKIYQQIVRENNSKE